MTKKLIKLFLLVVVVFCFIMSIKLMKGIEQDKARVYITPTPTTVSTITPTPTLTLTPTVTPTNTPKPTNTPTNTPTPTPTFIVEQEDNNAPKNTRKSYMSYKAITRKSSDQYKMQQQLAYTGEYGIRQVNDRFCVAVGTAYATKIGTYLDVVLENGTVIECILGDVKADQHTDASNKVAGDGSLVEFVVDTPYLSDIVRRTGDVSYACDEWRSTVVEVIVYDKVEEFER